MDNNSLAQPSPNRIVATRTTSNTGNCQIELCEKCLVKPVMVKDGKVYNLCELCWKELCT